MNDGPPSVFDIGRDEPEGKALERARQMLTSRRRRGAAFGNWISREVAWDILLVLYVHDRERKIALAQLAEMVSAPLTTAWRWVETLEMKGMVERSDHPIDDRISFVTLTEAAKGKLRTYFAELP